MYEEIPGLLAGSTVIISEDFIYNRTGKRGRQGELYIKCARHRDGCRGRGVISAGQLRITVPHEHENDIDKIATLRLRNSILQEAARSNDSLREIFDRVCTASGQGHLVTFAAMERTMRNTRLRRQPKIPATVDEFFELGQTAAVALTNDRECFF